MRVAVFGNSGSGKTTFARRFAAEHGLPCLELDAVIWEPGDTAVERDPTAVAADVDAWLAAHPGWVVEGCYAELIDRTLPYRPELVFLNPGVEACVARNVARPWEPEKYASPEDQDRTRETLLAWVRGYETRDDDWSYAAHRRLFDGYDGPKREIRD